MDVSPEYVQQCEKAEEIQNHIPEAGDYYLSGDGIIVLLPMKEHIRDFCTYECLYLVGLDDEVWLPRQDQLQKMMMEDAITLHQRMTEFIIRWAYAPLGLPQPSYEQLWLAFVMRRKHGKRWDNTTEEWVDDGDKG